MNYIKNYKNKKCIRSFIKCLNYVLSNWICIKLHKIPEDKSEHHIKPDSKFLFDFINILELNICVEGILHISFYHSITHKKTVTIYIEIFHHVFSNKLLYKPRLMIYEQPPR